jgi:hypothetical protein
MAGKWLGLFRDARPARKFPAAKFSRQALTIATDIGQCFY